MDNELNISSDDKEIYSKVMRSTNNGKRDSGILSFNNKGNLEVASSILDDIYPNVKIRDIDKNDEEDSSYYILYSLDLEEDFDDLTFMPNLNPAGTPIGNWSGAGFTEGLLEPIPESYQVYTTADFDRRVKKLKITEEEVEELKVAVKKLPPEASLGSGLYKFRWAPKSWYEGKSTATRVLYIIRSNKGFVFLVYIFDKDEKSNISDKELKKYRELAKLLGDI